MRTHRVPLLCIGKGNQRQFKSVGTRIEENNNNILLKDKRRTKEVKQ